MALEQPRVWSGWGLTLSCFPCFQIQKPAIWRITRKLFPLSWLAQRGGKIWRNWSTILSLPLGVLALVPANRPANRGQRLDPRAILEGRSSGEKHWQNPTKSGNISATKTGTFRNPDSYRGTSPYRDNRQAFVVIALLLLPSFSPFLFSRKLSGRSSFFSELSFQLNRIQLESLDR